MLESADTSVAGTQEQQADFLFAAGQLREASDLYRNIIQQDPGRLDVEIRLGHLALLQNHPQQAITHLAKALNNGLRSKAHWEMLANAYLVNGETGAAALCYDRAGRTALAGTLAVMAGREPGRVDGTARGCELSWLPELPLPVVQARVNGIPANLLVDTAAGDLVLDEKLAVAADVPHGGREQRYFAGGLPAMVTYGHVEQLQLGTFRVHDVLTQILELQNRFAGYSPLLPIHGIIGVSVLSRFSVVLDFQQRMLHLHRAMPDPITDAVDAALNESAFWIAHNQFIVVRVALSDSAAAMWVVDTAMSGAAFAVYSAAGEVAGLTPRAGEQAIGLGGGGIVGGNPVTLARLRLGGLDRLNAEGVALDTFPLRKRFGFGIAGLLACDYFRDTVLSLDFSRMKLTLAKQPCVPLR